MRCLAVGPLVAAALLVAGVAHAREDPKREDDPSGAPDPSPEPVRAAEFLVVTASRTEQPVAEAPPSLVVLSAADLDRIPAPTLDDALRQVPGFNLFRRTGSRVANPTSQGVSLRGLGPSGASRALVLVDGLPLNDPFGGWIHWGAVPLEAVERVEILRGGASDLYGSAALGGVIQVLTRPAGPRPDFSLEAAVGNESTAEGSLSAGGRKGAWGGRISAGGLTTDGYVLVDEGERGAVDTPAGADYASADLTLERTVSPGRVFLRGRFFGESRTNGTPLQTNRTHIDQVVVGADLGGSRRGRLALRIHASTQVYNQSFSAVAPGRARETLNRQQRVPAQDAGLSAQWSRRWAERHTVVAGIAGREIRGASDEVVFVSGAATSAVGAGGRERTASLFAEDLWRLNPRVQAGLALRFDRWSRSRALSVTTPLGRPGTPVITRFRDHDETSFNPRATLTVAATPRLDLLLAAYRSFRGPTLNELYRPFRVGDTLTLANPDLRAEHLVGGEVGARWRGPRTTVSGTAFWSETRDPVANVTQSATPQLVTRRRENLGRARARGVELDVEARLGAGFRLRGGYAFTDGVVARFPPSPELQGNVLPQLPRHQASLRASYEGGRLAAGAAVRVVGGQFEDDRNELRLAPFAVVDLMAGWRMGRAAEVFLAAENLLDERYTAGLTPTATVGPPLLVRAGLRLRLGGAGGS